MSAIPPPILSHFQARPLLQARGAIGQAVPLSLDLGLREEEAVIGPDGVRLPDGQLVAWECLEEIAASENNCFLLRQGHAGKIMRFSEETNRLYSLMPTQGAPTMLISGIPMHRIKDVDPHADTLLKIETIRPIRGMVLDTATGLGYTAIAAAKEADHVHTIELDRAALLVARQNPWSRALFHNPRITQHLGDSYDLIGDFAEATFDRIIHDPPTLSLAGHLYSSDFYAEMLRVLKPRGRAFHYIGDPDSRSGRNTTDGVIRRLQQVGFRRVVRRPRAFGVIAYK